jgi:two-component system, OmpR family, sensor histidine kinase CpxA
MKVSYPLSLKVSLWLMLNLLLLAAVGIGLLVVRGGLGWDALVAGPSGDRMQSLANIIAGEVSAAPSGARTAVLKRFGEAYNAEFYLFTTDETQIAGGAVELPPEVRPRMEFRIAGMGPGFRPGGFGSRGGRRRGDYDPARRPEPSGKGPRKGAEIEGGGSTEKSGETVEKISRDPSEKGRGGPDAGRREPPTFKMSAGEPHSGRFVVRAGTPSAYWVGMRVPFVSSERGFPIPAKVVARVSSMWGLLHLLNLQSWVLAGTAVLLLSVLFWLPLVRGITRSVGQLTSATERIAEGRFETRVKTHRRDELGKLGESVNRMATRLDAHMNGQKRFLGDVAHELCSPLARLQMATGILGEQAPPSLQDTVSDVREEVQQMSSLVNELLAFTKAGLRPRDVVCQPLDVGAIAREVLGREDVGRQVSLNIAEGMQAIAEPELLARALANLVRNALRYAGEAGPIVMRAKSENRQVTITVEDNGPGVPAADIDRLGEPFFRPELARTREAGGVGLGLAIVRNSIVACGGEVRFANRVPRGFQAEIRLKAA